MFTLIYGICLLVSIAALLYMAQKNYNNIDIYQWTIVILIPVIVMAYWLKSRVSVPEAASSLICFTYLDSTFMITAVLFAVMHTLGIYVKPWAKIVLYGLAAIQMSVVCICFNTNLYYKTIEVVWNEMGQAVKVTGGPLSFIHHIYLGILIACMAALFAVSMFRRGTYSKRNLAIYMLMPIGAFFVYFIENALSVDYSMLPVLYTIADVIIVLRYDNAHMHDISTMVAERHEGNETHGYVAIGLDRRFLSCNEKSYDFMPFLKDQRVNEKPSGDEESIKNINRLIDSFENDDSFNSTKLKDGNKTYLCEISYFSIRGQGKRQGYLLDISDFTEEQRAYDIVESFNENLNAEVAEKTENIRNMQRKIVLGMANMIENRDNNTGGHVKRTSDIIHILVDEIIKQGKMDISSQMAEDIVRAAPTHDLGKLTIDNNILNKPGRFTDEEYEIMKTHSTKSGEMVMILLDGVEEDRFVKVAFNVARYHHERWDGRGYPEGLVGTMIPLEARIMAVADVYDALVSKRVYKEPMSFEKSASIMCENMGTQFDPNMKSVFLGCREQLEEYYIRNDR